MARLPFYAAISLSCLFSAAQAWSEEASPEKMQALNNIRCDLEVVATMKAVSDTCFPGKDDGFKDFLVSWVKKYTAFKARDTNRSLDDVKLQVKQSMSEISKQPELCDPEGINVFLYSFMKDGTAEDQRNAEKDIDDALAIDQGSTMNPCL